MSTFETTEYAKTWDDLSKALERIREELPSMAQAIDEAHERMTAAREKPYTIAVCGEIKAGKSTLLNALFFKKNVLPSFVTPLTAKLTFIRYTDAAPYFEVEFLSDVEFETIRNSIKEDDVERKKMNQRLEICSKHGVRFKDYIGHDKIRVDGLDTLKFYVSDPASASFKGKEPIYTPMVKCVHIYINNDILKKVTIVDTPGLNDPNPINSQETSHWIGNASAVLYVLNVEGVNEKDTEFFKMHSLESAKSARIFVQNKIDTNSEYSSAKKQIYAYGKEELYKKMGLFSSDEVICSYSALGVLAKAKRDAGDELDIDEENCLCDLDSGIPEDPDNLMETLADRLCGNEGKVRLSEAVNYARSVYLKALTAAEESLSVAKLNLDMIKTDYTEQEAEFDRIRTLKRKFFEKQTEFCDERDRVVEEAKNDIDKSLSAAVNCILNELTNDINSRSRSCRDLANHVGARFSSLCNQHVGRVFKRQVGEIHKSMYKKLKEIGLSIYELAHSYGIPSYYFPPQSKLEQYIDRQTYCVNAIDVDALYDEMPNFWRRWFEGDDPRATAKTRVEKTLNEYLENVKAGLYDVFGRMGDDLLKEIFTDWENEFKQKEEEARKFQEKMKAGQIDKARLEDEIKQLDVTQQEMTSRLKLFNQQFDYLF